MENLRSATRHVPATHVEEIDAMRPVAQGLVIATHVLIFFGAAAPLLVAPDLLILTRVSRESFFFISAFALTYAYGSRPFAFAAFWRRRWSGILVPYLVWSVIYFAYTAAVAIPQFPYYHWSATSLVGASALGHLANLVLTGYYHLYYLLVLLQFFVVFPLLWVWLESARRWHGSIALLSFVLQCATDLALRAHWLPSFFTGKVESRALVSYPLYLLTGMIAALRYDEIKAWLVRNAAGIAVVTLVCAAGALASDHAHLSRWFGRYIAPHGDAFAAVALPYDVGAIAGILLLGIASSSLSTPRWWRRMTRELARDSFGVYLSQMIWIPLLVRVDTRYHLASRLWWPVLLVGALATAYILGVIFSEVVRRTPLAPLLIGRPRERLFTRG
ncbi:MAG TPA: acyltransferase [Acidimicrobiales bacterium]|nr:acyltransferase [Acidimicrobiales bacterium]